MTNPRLDRLRNDYQRLQQLAARSPYLHVLGAEGNPPTSYTLQFTCRGVERLNGGQPVYREDHRVRIDLGPQYPNGKPGLAWLTPIFHPNISGGGAVCIGDNWSGGGRYLDDLVIFLMQMVRYDGENLAFSASAFNPAAYQWAVQNRRLLPVDKRPMFGPSLSDSIRVVSSSRPSPGGPLDIRVNRRD